MNIEGCLSRHIFIFLFTWKETKRRENAKEANINNCKIIVSLRKIINCDFVSHHLVLITYSHIQYKNDEKSLCTEYVRGKEAGTLHYDWRCRQILP